MAAVDALGAVIENAVIDGLNEPDVKEMVAPAREAVEAYESARTALLALINEVDDCLTIKDKASGEPFWDDLRRVTDYARNAAVRLA